MQRFHPAIPGWNYRIVEKPKPGEYRFVRLAWKAPGCTGVMVQMHAKDWFIRYTAGLDVMNWGTKFVAPKPPAEWTLVTRDLFADFGERTITGIALTVFGGEAAYFDHIYFGRTVEDLDRIDATGQSKHGPLDLKPAELEGLWKDLAGECGSKSYRALWQLKAAKQGAAFVKNRLGESPDGVDAAKIRQWIIDLDDDAFAVRETASRRLTEVIAIAAPLLEKALKTGPSAEVRGRIRRLLMLARPATDTDGDRIEKAVRVLEYAGAVEALRALAKGVEGTKTTTAAKGALERLESRR